MHSIVFAPSIVYAPGDRWLTLLERLALLPRDARLGARARGLPADLGRGRGRLRGRRAARAPAAPSRHAERYELAGPETLSHNDIVSTVLRSLERKRPLVHVPTPMVSRALRLLERAMGARAPATWDEAELMEVSMTSPRAARPTRSAWASPPAAAWPRSSAGRPSVVQRLAATADARGAERAPGSTPALGDRPTARVFELRGQRQQRRLPRGAPDELHAERQPVLALVQRQRDRRAGRWR